MKCREVQKILTEEMALAASAEVRQHLKSCRECRDLQRDLLSLRELSGELKGRTKAPAFFTEHVCSRVSGRSRAVYWSLAATAAGLVLLVIGIADLTGFWTGNDGKAGSRVVNTGEPIQRIEYDNRVADASQDAQPDVFQLGGEESGSQETDQSSFGSHDAGTRVVTRTTPSGYVLELPATIEVRQTQADKDFYLENVSH
jgi:hypothetical protein